MMSERDLNRIEVLAQVDDGYIGVTTAASLMNMSRCHVYRLLDRFRSEGHRGIRHRARGRRPNNAIHPAKREYAMTLMRDRRRRIGKLFRREDLRTAVIGKLGAGSVLNGNQHQFYQENFPFHFNGLDFDEPFLTV